MTTSYSATYWEIRRNKSSKKPSYEVRWKVGGREKSRSFGTKALGDNWLSDFRQAAKRGEAFDVETGLPESMLKAKNARAWYAFAMAYAETRWPHSARPQGMTDALPNVTPVLTTDRPGRPDDETLRRALRDFAFVPADCRPPRMPEIASALRWLEAASLPITALEDAKHTRAALEALALLLDGSAAAALKGSTSQI
ncbi:hypothetical protein [Nonomuraea jabiensis]|uniref:Uncharacterized protein n=1 Tax=Nonomuraea jabiensis TaxID=882448 RepID=A0A7W9L7P3_9ACTN|nr:hypothetical protein [Nonomuraea jabiensis]MBB5773624.1 hypothetical protein [Nonomuraea jabiensis]